MLDRKNLIRSAVFDCASVDRKKLAMIDLVERGEHTNIPDGLERIDGFRWKLPDKELWNYEFKSAPDSWHLREAEIEWVTIAKRPTTPEVAGDGI